MKPMTTMGWGACHMPAPRLTTPRGMTAATAVALAMLAPGSASASFLSGEALDTAANVMSWVVLFIVPIVVIVVFWMVHVLPEKIAHRNHHPQRQAIQTLCLLSLAFGGLLWPLAWLWAYTKPVAYKVAYGTEKHEDYFHEHAEQVESGQVSAERLEELRAELDAMQARGTLSPALQRLRSRIVARQAADAAAVGAATEGRSA